MRQHTSIIVAFVSISAAVACTAATGTVDTGSQDETAAHGDAGATSSSGASGKSSSSSSSGSTSSSGGSTSSSSGSTSSSGGSTSSSSGSTSSSGGSSSGGDAGTTATCTATTTGQACGDCCYAQHPGANVGDDAFGSCVCQTPGTCATQCAATFCAGKPTAQGDACETCLQGATQCEQTATTACNANPDCTAFNTCFQTAGCASKP
jgi:hypothetical protein